MSEEITAEQREALKIAGELIAAGIPVFAAAPNSDKPGEYHLPKAWEQTRPDPSVLERWRPGWALAAVGGHAADFLDIDPRGGGRESEKELRMQGQFPRSFGRQETPSGGDHHLISATGERKRTGFMPGLDLQSGGPTDEHGKNGRGFVYIAPTVRPSKAPETLGQLRAYRWAERPDLELLDEFRGSDDSTEGVIARVYAARSNPRESAFKQAAGPEEQHTSSLFGGTFAGREFTRVQAEAFCLPYLEELERAPIGEIEERCNVAATALSHFVPAIWDAETAFAVLGFSLEKTAYNGATWDVEKFRPVLDGRRPPADNWKALLKIEDVREVQPASDAVDALLAEMRTPAEVRELPRPKPLIKKLLSMDSESWLIGEPGSKKSFVALDMAAHVARGQDWQGFKVTKAGVVMIVAEGAGGIGSRIKAWETLYGPMPDDIKILPRPVQAKDLQAWAVLVEACRRLAPGLVVIDTQARVTVGLEENSATELGIYIEAVRATREATGACVLTVHHTGRKGGDARGSSAIDGAQTTELKVVSEGLSGQLLTEKQKDMAMAPPITLKFESITVGVDEDGEDITSLALVADAFRRAAGEERPDDEPEEWEKHHGTVQVQILKVLRDHAGSVGLTEEKVRSIVAERFWHGQYHKTAKGALRPSTWGSAWTKCREKVAPASGDPVMVGAGGARWVLDPLAFAELTEDS
jgi:hypothetical protein